MRKEVGVDGDEEQVDAAKGPEALPDLRQTKHEDMGVQVQRDLTGSSFFLARGSKTHYSKIHFRSQGIARGDEPKPPEAISSTTAASESTPAETLEPEQQKTSMLGKLLGLFGR